MKKMVLCFVLMMMAAVTVSISANGHKESCSEHDGFAATTHVATQGTHCSGTVGCDCKGFSPITNGDVWQQAYCKHCGHKKSCHK